MIIVYDKDTKAVISIAMRVLDNGRWREPTLEELYPDVDHTKWEHFYVKDSPKYALKPDAWQIKWDENGAPFVGRKHIPTKIQLTTDASDTNDNGLPEPSANGKS